ncbi:hypothetical protein OESDEN_00118 [Oesophagostomum dentatum]|uniref:ZP domain-containing protein n=1 Tax=Oesophagostomum dentatum TaxID=61180 RepID=A0A0B1TQV2_OESDE|nr:hypothetical protein OESDEN_00118 [Oesophagostomum dentatum]
MQVDCEDSLVGLTFKTKKPFSGRVYVYGMAGDDKCSRAFIENRNQSRSCKKQNHEKALLQGLISSLVVVVSFHGTFVTKADRAYKCICFFRSQKTLTNAIADYTNTASSIYLITMILEMSPIGTTELLNTLPTPTCSYSIHTESPLGPVVMYPYSRPHHKIDVDGCAIDPAIQPDVLYEGGNKAIVEVYGYKFSDATVLNYECVLEICLSPLECSHLIPPKCDKKQDKNTFQRKSLKYKIVSLAHDLGTKRGQIEVAATLTMEDSMDPNTLALKDDTSAINNKQTNFSSSAPEQSDAVCLPMPTVIFSAALLSFIFALSMVIVFYVARYQTYVVNPKL